MGHLGFRRNRMTQKPFCKRDTGKGNAGAQVSMKMKLVCSVQIKITQKCFCLYVESSSSLTIIKNFFTYLNAG